MKEKKNNLMKYKTFYLIKLAFVIAMKLTL